jgi:polar amino acid transport system substrate-binding protein
MKQLLQYPRTESPTPVTVPDPVAQPGMVLIRNRASLISAGTERASVQIARASLVQKAKSRPDLVRQVLAKVRTEGLGSTIRKVRSRLAEPFAPGYSAAGIVVGLGANVTCYRIGDRIACGGQNFASHAEMTLAPVNLTCPLPSKLSFAEGSFATVGAVALQGIRTAAPQIGETVAVFGLGLLGQLTVQLLLAQGCRVVGIDPDETRCRAIADGASARTASPDQAVDTVSEMTGGLGVDSVIICAASDKTEILETAAVCARDRAIVVAVGAVPLHVPRDIFYRKELQLRLSRSYGPGRYDHRYEEEGIDYPIGYVRWTENRNMRAFLQLTADRRIDPGSLISRRFEIAQAEEAYRAIESDSQTLAVVFDYPDAPPPVPVVRRFVAMKTAPKLNTVGIGFWGCGQFAGGVLAPAFKAHADARLIGVCARTPISAEKASRQHGFAYATCDPEELLDDTDIEVVVIATPHRDHAAMAQAALAAGKTVFLEKPVATTREDLRALATTVAQKGGRLQIGFNRRFAPAIQQIRAAFARTSGPKTIIYRVNAGPPPDTGWLADPAQGSRLVGEVGHFADTILALTGSWPRRVWAERLGPAESDGVVCHLTLLDGSVGSIIYVADGSPRTPKEQIEIFGSGISARIDDFRRWSISDRRRTREYRGTQDKGHTAQIDALIDTLTHDRLAAGNWAAAISATEVTFAAAESLQTGNPVDIQPWL